MEDLPPSILNPLKNAKDDLQRESEVDVTGEVLRAFLPLIPWLGNAIQSLLAGKAQRRLAERIQALLEELRKLMSEMDESKIDKEFLEGEEFQTVFTQVLEQVRLSHDRAKLKTLAAVLANSSAPPFSQDGRKELFLNVLRALSPHHVLTLRSMMPGAEDESGFRGRKVITNPGGETAASLQGLAAHGLVELLLKNVPPNIGIERFVKMTESQINRQIQEIFQRPPVQLYAITRFGVDFVNFVSDPREQRAEQSKSETQTSES
jgi:hypothetical protein